MATATVRPDLLRRSTPSLGTYLGALVSAALLSALAMGGAAAWTAARGQRTALEAGLQDTARALVLAIDAEISGRIAALTVLATSPAFQPEPAAPDLPALDAHARRVAASIGLPIFVAARDGTVLTATSLPFGASLPPSNAIGMIERVFATGHPAVANLMVGAISGSQVFTLAAPVKDAEGRVVLAVAAASRVERLRDLLAAQSREGTFATLIDGDGIVVARSRDQARFAGQRLLPWVIEATTGRQAGLLHGPNRLGEVSLSAFRRLSAAPGWMVVLGGPVAIQDEATWRPVRALALGGLAALALALLVAVGIGRRILAPLAALTRRAEAVAADRGDAITAGAEVPSRVAEFERLREATSRAEAALRARAAEVAAGEARLRAVVDTAADAIVVADAEGWTHSFNRAAEDIFGFAAGDVIGRHAGMLFGGAGDALPWHPDDTPGIRREVEGRRRNGTAVPLDLAAAAWRDAEGRRFVTAIMRDITARKRAEEEQRLLVREVDHRAKNALAVVQSILRLTPLQDPVAFRTAVEERIAALARAHSLLARQGWRATDLRTLLEAEFAPHAAIGATVSLEGPPVAVSATAAQPIAMLAHELASNAVKHGALSARGGRVAVDWRVRRRADGAGTLRLRWEEAGGPPVPGAPARRGFGTRVIEATVRGQLGGTMGRHWESTGLIVEVDLPLARVQAENDAAPAAADSAVAVGGG